VRRLTTIVLLALLAGGLAAAPAEAADPTVVAAGNIACDANSPYYNGGAGTATRCRQAATGQLLTGASAVLALGDNQYPSGSLSAYQASYDPTWGIAKSITHPVPGTREYSASPATGYFDYFNGPGADSGAAGLRGPGYYSFDLGAWHLIALNTNCSRVSCARGSDQESWLRADLAAHPTSCTLAFGHAPRFSSGKPGGSLAVKPLWQALYDAGADVVLSAHARHYERFAPQAPSGRLDAPYGIRQFVAGTGGYALGALGPSKPRSEIRQNAVFGVLELTLRPTSYDWRFVPEAGATFADTGTGLCHAAPPVTPLTPAPTKGGRRGCTILGTRKPDALTGTPRRDVICGLGGNDRITGARGNDIIYGDSGDDVVSAGNGADLVLGGTGNDRLGGGRGSDRLSGSVGNDVLRGRSGRDRLQGGRGRDRLLGHAGNDFLDGAGDRTRDRLIGGRGRDRASAGRGDVTRSVERLVRRRA
jgi:hypothetical protein